MGETTAAERDELVRESVGWLDALLHLDDGHDCLTPVLVRYADRRGIADRGMFEEHCVDLSRVDVHTAGNDEVRAAVGEEEVAVVVHVADVAECEIVAPERRRRL